MRRPLLLSFGLHAAALALLAAPPPLPPAPDTPPRLEIQFGDADAAPAPPAPAGMAAAAAARGGGAPPGLRFAAPDPDAIDAVADPANRAPAYPPEAWARGEQGVVVLRLIIDAQGVVVRLEKRATSGYASLDAAAEQALARWHFRPARRGGRPVASDRIQPVRFVIE